MFDAIAQTRHIRSVGSLCNTGVNSGALSIIAFDIALALFHIASHLESPRPVPLFASFVV
jgi:hypothetical protein